MQQVEPRSDDQFVDVVIAESVGAALASHLSETGRGTHHPASLAQRVQMAVWKTWGTGSTRRFQDEHGGGWYTSVASAVDGEDLVAVVRTVHGRRMVCAVVESDEVEEFLKTNHWRTQAANGLDPDLAAEIAALEAGGSPGKPPKPQARRSNGAAVQEVKEPSPGDPRLIVWWAMVENGSETTGDPQVEHTTYGEAQQRVLRLLMQGAKVEVWESPKTPEIKVSL